MTSSLRLPPGWEPRGAVGDFAFAPGVVTVPQGVRAQADRAPDAMALVCGDARVTYAELVESAARCAAGLTAHGVVPGDRVAVWADRSTELVALLLGVMQAGAVYVPLDPSAPAARVRAVIEDSTPALVVAEPRLAAEASLPARVVAPEALTSAEPTDEDASSADAPAYIIYTSGSTGRPKGVVVPHRNVLALMAGTAPGFGLGPQDTWSWFHSAAFDFSVWEIWGCLLTGGRLVVAGEDARASATDFARLVLAEGVTVLSQTPSGFAALMAPLLAAGDAMPARLVVFGGEPLDTRGLLPWLDRFPPAVCRLVNMFGITETTVHVTWQVVDRALAAEGSRSVGRPFPGWTVQVVDADRRPLAPGEPGEIAVGGAGVAIGYWGREELTAEKFAPCPVTGERLYYSGDRGLLLPDGRLEHWGRIDEQVKLRGFRIEPGEIRSALLGDPAVAAAAVLLRRPVASDPAFDRLDAYVVPAARDLTIDPALVRSRLTGLLPDYMVPATVTAVDALPLTPNGKLDANALPDPLATGPAAGSPQTLDADEARVWQAWSAVLGEPSGADVNFFDAGGNSLLAARLVEALRAAGLTAARVKDVLLAPTVRRLAHRLRPSEAAGSTETAAPATVPGGEG